MAPQTLPNFMNMSTTFIISANLEGHEGWAVRSDSKSNTFLRCCQSGTRLCFFAFVVGRWLSNIISKDSGIEDLFRGEEVPWVCSTKHFPAATITEIQQYSHLFPTWAFTIVANPNNLLTQLSIPLRLTTLGWVLHHPLSSVSFCELF